MIESHANVAWDAEHDEGELNSDDDSRESSSEGVTTDGDESSEDDRSDKLNPPSEETPWERGLRLARDRARKAKTLRQADADLEAKRLYFKVVAPDPSEDNVYANVCDLDRPNLADAFWLNYHKLAIVGCTQLTCKRSLPCDLSPPSQRTMSRWRKRLHGRARSSDDSACSSAASSNVTYGSRSSSLSSLAGSILFAVPDLVLADYSDREGHRRRHRGGDISVSRSSSSSSSGTGSRSARHVSSSQNSSRSSKVKQKNQQRKRGRGIYSASSSSSTSPTDASNALLKSKGRLSEKESGPIVKDEGRAWWGRRPPIVSYDDQRHPLPQAMPQISGYHHQQNSFSRGSYRNGEKDSNYSGRHSFGDSNRWSSDQPPPMPSQRPVKRPWVAEPPKSKGSFTRQPSPPAQLPRSRRSRSRSVSRDSPIKDDKATPATGITSWSQSHGSRHSFSKSNLTEYIPSQTNMPSTAGKRGVSFRRKSRSPFADSYFGNPPAPAEMPFEQSVPLLAGAVNPAAPPPPNSTAATKALPSASARPGVKLRIAPRVRGGLVLPGSALERAHRGNHYKVNGSPVSSASSGGRSASCSPSRRGKPGLSSPIAAKRMRHLGYTAVSPGGFESPPPLPSPFVAQNRPYSKVRRFEVNQASGRMRNRVPVQDRGDGHYSRAGGDNHDRSDRFSRSCQRHPPPERYRDRRPPPPQPERFDRRGMTDKRALTYDRYRPSRDYMGNSSFVYSRAEERDNNRSYGGSRHGGGNRRQGNAARSRSPFEGRVGTGGDHLNSDSVAEQRLNELRRRLTMVDDKIAELGGALVAGRR